MQQSQTYIDILNNCRIDATTPIPDDNIYLVIQNKTIGSTGNFVSIVGQAKSGKSNFIAAIIAAGISKKEIFSICVLTYEHHQKTRICYFDTEQGSYDWQFKAQIIKQLSKKSNIYEKLDVFTVREFSSKQILFLIKVYLENTPTCAVLIIDGLLDCIDNMNNEIEAKIVIKKIRKMAKDFDVLIISALHLSKKDKMTIGHIGSSSDRYAQSTLEVEKTKENTMILAPKLLRSAGWFEPIEIEYNEHTKKLVHLNP